MECSGYRMSNNSPYTLGEDCLAVPAELVKSVARLQAHLISDGVMSLVSLREVGGGSVVESFEFISFRFGGNLGLIKSVLNSLAPSQLNQLERLSSFSKRRDPVGAASVLHAMRGACGTMGAQLLSTFAGELEHRLVHDDKDLQLYLLVDEILVDVLRELIVFSDRLLKNMFDVSV